MFVAIQFQSRMQRHAKWAFCGQLHKANRSLSYIPHMQSSSRSFSLYCCAATIKRANTMQIDQFNCNVCSKAQCCILCHTLSTICNCFDNLHTKRANTEWDRAMDWSRPTQLKSLHSFNSRQFFFLLLLSHLFSFEACFDNCITLTMKFGI